MYNREMNVVRGNNEMAPCDVSMFIALAGLALVFASRMSEEIRTGRA